MNFVESELCRRYIVLCCNVKKLEGLEIFSGDFIFGSFESGGGEWWWGVMSSTFWAEVLGESGLDSAA